MQNAGPSYQGSAQPGVNFSDRSYDNQIGAHCQPNSYQPYINAPYHPVASPRPHHYGNHQMQQGIPYNSVHHGGAYAPNQNQYGPNTNQDMYRNHHPAYVGNNRNMPTKPVWGENATPNADMMQPYNQMPPQAQMMNNPSQMPVSAMRSPPQGTPMSMNPAQSPGPQHYRQLQSPNHSPHSWPQVQVPSPGILHSTRTTPSPLSTHVRSPGHSQPFSPPAAAHHSSISVNLQTHASSVVQDNDQCVSNISNASNKDSVLNPLHSLQKMVMLDQEMKPNLMQLKCEVTNDNCDHIISQPSDLNVIEGHDTGNESKDSSYSTYFNLDEKCIDSKAQTSAVVNTDYSNTSSVSNVASSNPQATPPLNPLGKPKDESPKNAGDGGLKLGGESFKLDDDSLKLGDDSLKLGDDSLKSGNDGLKSGNDGLKLDDDSLKSGNDDLKSVNDDLKLVNDDLKLVNDDLKSGGDDLKSGGDGLKSSDNGLKSSDSGLKTSDSGLKSSDEQMSYSSEVSSQFQTNQDDTKSEVSSSITCDSISTTTSAVTDAISQAVSVATPVTTPNEISDVVPDSSIHLEKLPNEISPDNILCNDIKSEQVDIAFVEPLTKVSEPSALTKTPSPGIDSERVGSTKISEVCDLSNDIICKEEKETGQVDDNLNSCEVVYENVGKNPKPNLRRRRAGVSYEEYPSPEKTAKIDKILAPNEIKVEEKTSKKVKEIKMLDKNLQRKPRGKKCEVPSERPVKVVIHRIRKSDTDDTWHVPNSGCGSTPGQETDQSGNSLLNDKTKESPKVSNIGPQIIILSPAMSKKKFGTAGSGNPNAVITINEDETVVETVDGKVVSETTNVTPTKQLNNQKSPKKTPGVSKPKRKPASGRSAAKSSSVKKGKGKKSNKNKKKLENTDVEVVPKLKRSKVFNGPYVHITGSKQNPVTIKVVNVAPREEEKDPKQQKPKREFSGVQREFGGVQRKIRVGHSCTLSPHYDAFNKDKTWLCSFCHKGSHQHGLGDLYGPYYINGVIKQSCTTSNEQVPAEIVCAEVGTPQASTTRGTRSKRKKSELSEECAKTSPPSKKSKQAKKMNAASTPNVSPVKPPSNLVANIPIDAESGEKKSPESLLQEVWIHEDCVVWCQGVSLMGQQIHGLDEAIHEAVENVCSACKLVGATLGCWSKGCNEQYHYSCAKEKGCEMDIDVFSLLCPHHLKRQQTSKLVKHE